MYRIALTTLLALTLSTGYAQWCFNGPDQIMSTQWDIGITTSDFNGDAMPDLAVARYYVNEFAIYLNAGGGTFGAGTIHTLQAQAWPRCFIQGDFNADSIVDLIVLGRGSGNMCVFNGDGIGGFTQMTNDTIGSDLTAGCAGHFDSDSTLDWAVVDASNSTLHVFFGDNQNGFWNHFIDTLGGRGPIDIKAADINHDSVPDLIISDKGGFNASMKGVDIYLGNGSGGFAGSYQSLNYQPWEIELIDYNYDGEIDLLLGSTGAAFYMADGNGNGTFNLPGTQRATTLYANSLTIADIDADGYNDVMVTGGVLELFSGNGSSFDSVYYNNTSLLKAAVIEDFNGDSALDLAMVQVIYTTPITNATSIFLNCFVGVEQPSETNPRLSVFPNPAEEQLLVQQELIFEKPNGFIRIFNSSGQLIFQMSKSDPSDATVEIDVSQFVPGLYLLEAGNNDYSDFTRFLKL